jgi:undecaprenyl diphosphate synthase
MKIPEHLAIIMDGNRRWPKKINKANVTEGHRVGADRLEEIVENVEIWG